MSVFRRRRAPSDRLDAVRADSAHLGRQLEQARDLTVEWEKKAMLAVNAGNDLLAVQALLRRHDHELLARAYEAQWTVARERVAALERAAAALRSASAATPVAVPTVPVLEVEALRRADERLPGFDGACELDKLKAKMGIVPKRRSSRDDDRGDDDLDRMSGLLAALAAKKKLDEN